MAQQIAADGGPDETHVAADLETIVVDPDDIITAFERNDRDETEQRSHVFRVTPPLKGEQEASLYVSKDYNFYPPEMDPKPIHLGTNAFVSGHIHKPADNYQRYPSLSETRSRFRDEIGDPEEHADEWEEWWDVELEVWENAVRSELVDEITITGHVSETTVEVRYE